MMNNRTLKELEEAIRLLQKNKEECVPFGFDGDNKANTQDKITIISNYIKDYDNVDDVELFLESQLDNLENDVIEGDMYAYLTLDCEIEDILYPLACQWKNL